MLVFILRTKRTYLQLCGPSPLTKSHGHHSDGLLLSKLNDVLRDEVYARKGRCRMTVTVRYN